MKGMTFEFAVTRIFELESKKDHAINRLMIDNYLTALQRGMKKNVAAYYKMRGLDPEKGSELLRQTQREMMLSMNKVQYKQFEIKGYEQMIERIMQQPMQKAIEHSNDELSTRLQEIKDKLTKQTQKNNEVEKEMEDYVVNTLYQKELQEALKRKAEENGEKFDKEKKDGGEEGDASSYYDSEDESEDEKTEKKVEGEEESKEEEKKVEDQENKNIENYIDKKTTGASQPIDDIEDAEMIKKMRREWEQLHGDPSQMDEKLKSQISMLNEIGRNNGEAGNFRKEQTSQEKEQMVKEFNMIHSVASQPLTQTDINIKASVTSTRHAFSD